MAPAVKMQQYSSGSALQSASVAARAASAAAQMALPPGERAHVERLLRAFQQAGAVKDQALALYVNAKLYRQAMPEFRDWLLAGMGADLRAALLGLAPGDAAAHQQLFPYFAEWVLGRYTADIKAYR